jgi:3',5'-cyclic AMP phosphodiesterase CpdA
MLTILHASDLQFGKPFRPRAGEAFRNLAFDVMPHLIVVSGDLTQRAKPGEFKAAWEFLKRLPTVPLVVTPGNHDVPLYRIWERAVTPFWRWRKHVPRDVDSVAQVAGAMIVGLNSASPYRAIVNGRIERHQMSFARKAFASGPPGAARVLVVHHHFISPPSGEGGAPMPRARKILEQIEEMEVDLVLSGHLHQTFIASSRDLVPGDTAGVPLIHTGTTTSRRGRGPERRKNSVNIVKVLESEIEVTPHLFESRGAAFEPGEKILIPRPGTPVTTAYPGTFSKES